MINYFIGIIKRKFIFKTYLKKKYLILENLNSELLIKFLGVKDTEVVSLRSEINIFLVFKLLFSLKRFNQINYYLESIKQIDPKKIITNIDTNPNFYKLKRYFPNKTFISIQNGVRIDNTFKNEKNLKCDLIFCHGFKDIDFYKKIISSSVIPLGSLKNNDINNYYKKETNCISYISQFREVDEKNSISHFLGKDFKGVTWGDYIKSEKKLISTLYKICQKKNIKLYIVGASFNSLKEKNWYVKLLNSSDINFISRNRLTSSYDFLKKSKITVCMHSTLGYEFLARGKKVIFFSRNINNLNKINKKIQFGYPFIKKTRGFFYTNQISEDQIIKLIM